MTPTRAIKINCRFSHGGIRTVSTCKSKYCLSNRMDLSVMERIRRGCWECAADHKPEECKGVLLGTQRKILTDLLDVPAEQAVCPLLPYRMGKNQNLRRVLSEDQRKAFAERARAYRFQKKEPLSSAERIGSKG